MKKYLKEYREFIVCFVAALLLMCFADPAMAGVIWLGSTLAYFIWRLHNFVTLLAFKVRYIERVRASSTMERIW
jgi:hypothetical protein